MTAEERAAVEWLEGLTPIQRANRFHAAVSPIIGYDSAFLFAGLATLKDDHEDDRAHCVACKDPSAVVVA
jgi:hypothetical protein